VVKQAEHHIDPSIEDPTLRAIDWQISIFTLVEDWRRVLKAKWQRVEYITKG
jgi:hypothetical protein